MNGNRLTISLVVSLGGALAFAQGCGDAGKSANGDFALSSLLDDADPRPLAPGSMAPPPATGRACPSGDCARDPLALWGFDDCNTLSTQLADTASSYPISHPAFRAVSVACVAGIDGQAVKVSAHDDIVYVPDQIDFAFSGGLTVAAWLSPDSVTGTQSIVRKRYEGSSSFVLAVLDRKVTFVLRLTNGRVVNVSAPIRANRFAHVAATYDGNSAMLYLDGALAAKANVRGTITPGAGPILIANDANGRRFNGIVDTVWLNTRASPADVIAELPCIRRPPIVSLTPGETPPQVAGATVPFDLGVTSTNSNSCPIETFRFFGQVSYPLLVSEPFAELSVSPGQTANATVHVSSAPDAQPGVFPFGYRVYGPAFETFLTATYRVASTRVSTGIPLPPDGNGHYDGSNAAGVLGYWWSTGDDYGTDDALGSRACRAAGFPASACSVLTAPTPGTFFQPDPGGRGMCTSGVAARVIPDATGALAWSSIWGDVIGFNLNNPGTIADGSTKVEPYDAVARGITGLAFDIDAVPVGGHLRVGFATLGTEQGAAYWRGTTADLSPISTPGHYEIRWPEVGGPLYLPSPPPFDPTQLKWIQFHVVSTDLQPVPFSFCVSNVILLTN